MSEGSVRRPVADDVYLAIQRFLVSETDCLDRRAYKEWLGLLTDDVSYVVKMQLNSDAATGRSEYAIIDESAAKLKARVEQIDSPRLTHAENPPSLVRRFISNLRAEHGAADAEYQAVTNMLVYRGRPDMPEGGFYVGERRDVLRRVGGELRLARREVSLEQAVLYGCVSVIF